MSLKQDPPRRSKTEPSDELVSAAEDRLIRALTEYEAPASSAAASEFYELKLQACIFNYDISRAIVSLWKDQPTDFALNVALKDVVHKLYEYDQALSGRLVNRVLALARQRNAEATVEDIKNERKKWREQFAKLRAWSDLRNQTSGHYGKDIARQVQLIKQLNIKEVHAVAIAFLSYNVAVLKTLAGIGRG